MHIYESFIATPTSFYRRRAGSRGTFQECVEVYYRGIREVEERPRQGFVHSEAQILSLGRIVSATDQTQSHY